MSTVRIFFVGVGGQGNILATKLLGAAAILAEVPISISETHGMGQRGGVVESSAVIGAQSPIISDHDMVMLGALIDIADIPLPADSLRRAIKIKTKTAFVNSNLQCFDCGIQTVRDKLAMV